MAPPQDPQTLKAIQMVSAARPAPHDRAFPDPRALGFWTGGRGCRPREAWVRCGKPKGEAGIQRIRKAGFKLRKPQPVLPPRAPAKPSEPTGPGKGMPARGYRLTSTQLKKEQVAQQKAKQEWDAVYAVATVEWQRRVAAGMTGRGQQSAADFAASVEVPAALGASRSRSTCSSVRCASSFL